MRMNDIIYCLLFIVGLVLGLYCHKTFKEKKGETNVSAMIKSMEHTMYMYDVTISFEDGSLMHGDVCTIKDGNISVR